MHVARYVNRPKLKWLYSLGLTYSIHIDFMGHFDWFGLFFEHFLVNQKTFFPHVSRIVIKANLSALVPLEQGPKTLKYVSMDLF